MTVKGIAPRAAGNKPLLTTSSVCTDQRDHPVRDIDPGIASFQRNSMSLLIGRLNHALKSAQEVGLSNIVKNALEIRAHWNS
jgi:hypothetical protein